MVGDQCWGVSDGHLISPLLRCWELKRPPCAAPEWAALNCSLIPPGLHSSQELPAKIDRLMSSVYHQAQKGRTRISVVSVNGKAFVEESYDTRAVAAQGLRYPDLIERTCCLGQDLWSTNDVEPPS